MTIRWFENNATGEYNNFIIFVKIMSNVLELTIILIEKVHQNILITLLQCFIKIIVNRLNTKIWSTKWKSYGNIMVFNQKRYRTFWKSQFLIKYIEKKYL